MRKIILGLATWCLLSGASEAELRPLQPLGGSPSHGTYEMQEAAETSRQEKWMMLVGLVAAAGIGIYLWQDYQKNGKNGKK